MRRAAAALAVVCAIAGGPTPGVSAPDPTARLVRSGELLREGYYREALAQVADLSRRDLRPEQAATLNLVRAQTLTEAGDYEAGLIAARAALISTKAAFGEASAPHFRALMAFARVSGLAKGTGQEAADALTAALAVAKALSGDNGLHALEVVDRVSLVLSANAPAEALRQNDKALEAADGMPGLDPVVHLRLVNTRGIILVRARRYDEALKTLDVARKGRAEILGADHPETLQSEHNYARALDQAGRTAEAEAVLADVLRRRMKRLGADHPDTLTTHRVLATLRLDRFDPQALGDLRQVAAMTEARAGATHASTLEALASVGEAMDRLGDLEGGLAATRAVYAKALAAHGEADSTVLDIGHQLGAMLARSGRRGEALQVLDDVLVGTRRGHADDHPDVLATLNAIAAVQLDLGRPEQACPLLERVLADMSAGGGRNELNRLTVQNNLAVCWRALGRASDAFLAIQTVAARREALLGPDAALTLSSRSTEAAWLSEQGDHEAAIALQRRILAARRAAAPRGAATLSSLHNLAAALDTADRDVEALDVYREAVAARDLHLGTLHPDTITSRRMLAGRLLQSGDRAGARAIYANVLAAVEETRADAALTDVDRRSYFATVADIHKTAALLAARDGDSAAAITAAERARARTLTEVMSHRGATRSVLPPSQAAELAALERAVAAFDLSPAETDPVVAAARAAERGAAARRLAEAEARAARGSPAYAAATRPPILTAAELLERLPQDAAHLEFVTLGDRVLLLWIAGGRSGATELGDAPHLADTVEAYRAVMANPRGLDGLRNPPIGLTRRRVWALPGGGYQLRGASDPPASAEALPVTDVAQVRAALSKALLDRLPAEVIARDRWIISPDGPLGLLAFETLDVDGAPVLTRREVSYAASLSTLVVLKARSRAYTKQRRAPMLAFGDPAYGVGPGALATLPASKAELAALQALYGLRHGETLFSGAAATRPRLLALAQGGRLRGVRHLVISAHGVLDADAPDRSAVALTPSSNPPDDGYLRAAELMALDLRTDLVMLSACETGAGRWRNGEGVLGLPFALIVAGSNATLLTQWSIPDESAAEFTRRFFAKVQAGQSYAQALAGVKREFASGAVRSDWTAPAHWAAFVLYGD